MARVKVRTLVPGLPGFDALGQRIELQAGIPAWMDEATAKRLERQGKLQCLAGLSTQDLKPVQEVEEEETPAEPGKKPKRKGYKRRDVVAEPALSAKDTEDVVVIASPTTTDE